MSLIPSAPFAVANIRSLIIIPFIGCWALDVERLLAKAFVVGRLLRLTDLVPKFGAGMVDNCRSVKHSITS